MDIQDKVYQLVRKYSNGTQYTDSAVFTNRETALNIANSLNSSIEDNRGVWIVKDISVRTY